LIGRAPDHNSAEWSLWIGRPLLGQWSYDVRRSVQAVLDSIDGVPDELAVVGIGTGGLVALVAAAQEDALTRVGMVDSLTSYISEVPYQGQRLGLMAPGILRHTGDIAHLAALVAPRRLLISGPIDGAGLAIPEKLWASQFAYPWTVYSLRRERDRFAITGKLTSQEFAEKFDEL
jgi:hypothetical protein